MTVESVYKGEEKITVHVDPDIADLIPGFLENRRADIRMIDQALTRGDLELIRGIGHSMKGAGGSYGFDAITDIGKAIEEGAKRGDVEAINRAVRELSSYLDRVEVVFD